MLGEFELIAKLRELTGAPGPAGEGPAEVMLGSGDDAAITVPGGATATSVDALVEGVHFDRATASPRDIGRKALSVALSDLAAMGAIPGEAYVQLGVPPGLEEEDLIEIGAGLAEVARAHGVRVLGGDVTRAPCLMLGMTVVGHAESASALVSRAGARPGDAVAVTGELGGAAAGLLLLERPDLAAAVPAELARSARRRQLDPTARVAAGRALADAGASAMIDLSDGLGGDALHLARASGTRIRIELSLVPLAPGLSALASASGADEWELATAHGDDYELLATIPEPALEGATAALRELGIAFTRIGAVEAGAGVSLVDPLGVERAPAGFDQLRSARAPGARASRGAGG